MKSFTVACIAGFIGLSAAAPTQKRAGTPIYPTYLTQHELNAPYQNTFNTDNGIATFSQISTIATFEGVNLPGRQCKLGFRLEGGDSVTGSGKVQVFSTNKILPKETSYGSSGRDQHIGTFAVRIGEASVVAGDPTAFQRFDCPTGQTVAWEVAATWDVGVTWDASRGLYLATV